MSAEISAGMKQPKSIVTLCAPRHFSHIALQNYWTTAPHAQQCRVPNTDVCDSATCRAPESRQEQVINAGVPMPLALTPSPGTTRTKPKYPQLDLHKYVPHIEWCGSTSSDSGFLRQKLSLKFSELQAHKHEWTKCE